MPKNTLPFDVLITNTTAFVKQELKGAEGGHDWFHVQRVYKNALLISENENANKTIVALGALLHDIADSKFHDGDESIGPRKANAFLQTQGVSQDAITPVSYTHLTLPTNREV